METYQNQKKSKDDLQESLRNLANKVKDDTGHPLVFIVDELDRCRPPFAIHLLERVKHIFDIPNIVFVFGINREQLCSSVQSMYGEVDANTYLRRFFDMEFSLGAKDDGAFLDGIIKRYQLNEILKNISIIGERRDENILQKLCTCMDMSLRDIQRCVQALIFVARNNNEQPLEYEHLAVTLIVIRLKDPPFYRKLKQGKYSAHEANKWLNDNSVNKAFLGEYAIRGTKAEEETLKKYLTLIELATG